MSVKTINITIDELIEMLSELIKKHTKETLKGE